MEGVSQRPAIEIVPVAALARRCAPPPRRFLEVHTQEVVEVCDEGGGGVIGCPVIRDSNVVDSVPGSSIESFGLEVLFRFQYWFRGWP